MPCKAEYYIRLGVNALRRLGMISAPREVVRKFENVRKTDNIELLPYFNEQALPSPANADESGALLRSAWYAWLAV